MVLMAGPPGSGAQLSLLMEFQYQQCVGDGLVAIISSDNHDRLVKSFAPAVLARASQQAKLDEAAAVALAIGETDGTSFQQVRPPNTRISKRIGIDI